MCCVHAGQLSSPDELARGVYGVGVDDLLVVDLGAIIAPRDPREVVVAQLLRALERPTVDLPTDLVRTCAAQ